jgi:hypothetical protein
VAVINLLVIIFYLWLEKKNLRSIVVYLLGMILPWVGLLVYFILTKSLAPAINQIIVLNFTHYPSEPITKVLGNWVKVFGATLPLWILFGFFLKLIDRKNKIVWVIILMVFLPIPTFLIRHYPHYWISILPFIAIGGAGALEQLLSFRSSNYHKIKIVKMALILMTIYFLIGLFWMQAKIDFSGWLEQFKVADFLRTLPNQKILAENQFTPYYYLANKKPFNKYLYITEINDWSEQTEKKTIEGLRNDAETIIVWPTDQNFAYAKNLQNFILKDYRPIRVYSKLGLGLFQKNTPSSPSVD